MLNRNPQDYLLRFVTVVKTWFYHFIMESKMQSKQWTASRKSAPKKAKIVLLARKVMVTSRLVAQGKIITNAYCATLLDRLKKGLEQELARFAKKKVLFLINHHCNGQIAWIKIRVDSSSTLLCRFGLVRLLIPKLENLAW